ncbi:methyltransferase-like 26 [Pollicipes pollicipes]|uniref:methyltransferase-like 26 n=1 Tax=Pollicipes pollicipes TaxID=41117 RepID=UPI001885998C|nr:methyltransferase-like 26 [Pollicipes pollicipes]
MLHSQAAEDNKDVLLAAVRDLALAPGSHVLEVASGTGQHVTHLADHLPQLTFHPSDVNAHMLATMHQRLTAAPRANVCEPRVVDAADPDTWCAIRGACFSCRQRLQAEDASWGLRDVDELVGRAEGCGLRLVSAAPAGLNQTLLLWRKRERTDGGWGIEQETRENDSGTPCTET